MQRVTGPSALQAEQRTSASLRCELQKAKEEISHLQDCLRLERNSRFVRCEEREAKASQEVLRQEVISPEDAPVSEQLQLLSRVATTRTQRRRLSQSQASGWTTVRAQLRRALM